MALKGNLRDFSTTQLLNLINLARKTGTLAIDARDDRARLSFREGKLVYATLGQDAHLAAILHRAGKLSEEQARTIQTQASAKSDKELGLLLINANYITQEDVLNSLETEFLGNLKRLFTWMEGIFRFETDVLPPDGKITLRISLENIIIEGTRQLRELEHLQDEIPSLDVALKFADRPGTNIKKVNLSVEEWRVVSYINPKNSIRRIARTTKMNDLEIRRIVYGLLQAGLVEITRPDGMPPPVSKRPDQLPPQPVNKEEQKSLINRLITRIRSI